MGFKSDPERENYVEVFRTSAFGWVPKTRNSTCEISHSALVRPSKKGARRIQPYLGMLLDPLFLVYTQRNPSLYTVLCVF